MTPRTASASFSIDATLPAFLTVEEAASILRIGRTAAYQLARKWESTEGVEGLPVVRFGRLLRVPMRELERLAAGAIERPRAIPPEPEHAASVAPLPRPSERRTPDPSCSAQMSLFQGSSATSKSRRDVQREV